LRGKSGAGGFDHHIFFLALACQCLVVLLVRMSQEQSYELNDALTSTFALLDRHDLEDASCEFVVELLLIELFDYDFLVPARRLVAACFLDFP
jgi:hypothetical protein